MDKEKILKWAGWEKLKSKTLNDVAIWQLPNSFGSAREPDLTDLNFLFQWIVPKLQSRYDFELNQDVCFPGLFSCRIREPLPGIYPVYHGQDKDPATAILQAVEKVMEEK